MRYPVLTGSANGRPGPLPSEREGLRVSRPGVMVTAFGRNPDGEGTLLRLWEQAGSSGMLTVTLPDGSTYTKAQPVNLRGEALGEPIPIKSGKLSVDLGGFAPASFILQM